MAQQRALTASGCSRRDGGRKGAEEVARVGVLDELYGLECMGYCQHAEEEGNDCSNGHLRLLLGFGFRGWSATYSKHFTCISYLAPIIEYYLNTAAMNGFCQLETVVKDTSRL